MSPFIIISIVGATFAIGGIIWTWLNVVSPLDFPAPKESAGDRWQEVSERGSLVIGDVPQQPAAFQARTELLEYLNNESVARVSVVHAVTGMPGVGKTQVAAAYARQRIAQGWQLVAWVDASSGNSIVAGLKSVAESVGLARADEHAQIAAERVRHWLETDGSRRLVVFDNVTDLVELRKFLPAAGKAQIVITSTRRAVTQLSASSVAVDVFTIEESVRFLTERTGLADTDGAQHLANELGCLPLALAQAAAVISQERLLYDTYLARLQALSTADYLMPAEGDPYPRSVASTIQLSLRTIENDSMADLSRTVMGLLSILSEGGAPRSIIRSAADINALQSGIETDSVAGVDAAIGRLVSASLVTLSLDGSFVTAHRLVMRVVREQMAARGELDVLIEVASRTLAELINNPLMAWESPAKSRDFVQQVTGLNDHVYQRADTLPNNLVIDILSLRATALRLLNELGDSANQAIEVGSLLVADRERVLGGDHPDTLTSRNDLAGAYLTAGRLAEAIPLYEQTLAAQEQMQGADQPDTLITGNNLAVAYQSAGRLAEAIPRFEQVLADRKRVLGADHPDTLTSRDNLAGAYLKAGRLTEAIPIYELVLADRERVLGFDHPAALASGNSLAGAYQAAGRLAEAILLLERLLANRERIFGDYPMTRALRANLVRALSARNPD